MLALLAVVQVPAAGVSHAPPAPKASAAASESLRKVKWLAVATLMYALDNGDALPSAAKWRTAVMPYLKDPDGFTVPGAPKGSVGYSLDPRLAGVSIKKPPLPAETAMILQGAGGKPTFPYGGLTVVGLLDGHAKLVDAKALQKARTNPLKRTP